jgi:D-cysteine desulfhydrase
MNINFEIPEKLSLANFPTRIEKLERLTKELNGPNIYIKRDDQTGMEWSGNKVRKLEYSVKEALNKGCNSLITCGGNQSNHCRATAAVAAKLGLECCLVLRGSKNSPVEGNLFLDKLLGAETKFITPEEYSSRRNEIMKEIALDKEKAGHKPYIIPEGASNGIGSFGYYNAMLEIIEQEKEMNLQFDAIAIAVGSGGTYSGLLLAKQLENHKAVLAGYLVGGSISYFTEEIQSIFRGISLYAKNEIKPRQAEINFIDNYIGPGYGLNTPEQLTFIKHLAQLEGVVMDNVYTGKAMHGLVSDIKKGKYQGMKNILFIHTGGLFELFSQTKIFQLQM